MQLPKDDRQVELDHILDLHRKPGMLPRDNRVVYEPTLTDYTSGDQHSGTGDGSQKTDKKPETY